MYVSVRAQRLKIYVRLHRSNQSSAPEFILIMCSDVRGEVNLPARSRHPPLPCSPPNFLGFHLQHAVLQP